MNATANKPTYRVAPAPGRKVVAVCQVAGCDWRSEPTTGGGFAGAKFDRHLEEKHS